MTVSSLWTVLDEAGCGTPVGIEDFQLRGQHSSPTILAVDLSIWICEAIGSTALSSFHYDPALYLVYERTTALLRIGLGLVFVLEGKRRTHYSSTSFNSQEFKQRRSGSEFWSALKRCESLLHLLGVPVLQAEAEGEALCALLNAKGLSDAVVSNDGDCFLFGAQTIYTKFSLENLKTRKVIRYDAAKLMAKSDVTFPKKNDNGLVPLSHSGTITLCREDLIAFAILTGSDLLGGGVPHVGYKKAIHFLYLWRVLKQKLSNRTCLEELLSWGDLVLDSKQTSVLNEFCMQCDDDGPRTINHRSCSVCSHSGDKRQHMKQGCTDCGTGVGEGCFIPSKSDIFLFSLKEKALKMTEFAPRNLVNEYFTPNSNSLPRISFEEKLRHISPHTGELFNTSMMIKGKTLDGSKEYVRKTLLKLLARIEIWADKRNKYVSGKQKFKPSPLRIEKIFLKDQEPCYEVIWSILLEDSNTFTFTTIEPQSLLENSKFSALCKEFKKAERLNHLELERHKQFMGRHPPVEKLYTLKSKRLEKSFRRNPKRKRSRKRARQFDASKIRQHQHSFRNSTDVAMLMENIGDKATTIGHVNEVFAPTSPGCITSVNIKDTLSHDEFSDSEYSSIDVADDFSGRVLSLECIFVPSVIGAYEKKCLLDYSTSQSGMDKGTEVGSYLGEFSCNSPQPNFIHYDRKLNGNHSNGFYQDNQLPISGVNHTSKSNVERVFCDLGISIEITPILCHRE